MTTEHENCFSSNGESKTICCNCLRTQPGPGLSARHDKSTVPERPDQRLGFRGHSEVGFSCERRQACGSHPRSVKPFQVRLFPRLLPESPASSRRGHTPPPSGPGPALASVPTPRRLGWNTGLRSTHSWFTSPRSKPQQPSTLPL